MRGAIFVMFLLPIQLIAQYNWQPLNNAPKSWRNDDVYFLNAKTGWAIHAYYSPISPSQYGQIYSTYDGGGTWQLIKDSSKAYFRAVGFADSLVGWVGNLADTNSFNGFAMPPTHDTIPMYQTSNGGKSWIPVNLPIPHPIGICGISVVNDSVIYAYGRWNSKWIYNYPVGYVKTLDKGKTWVYHDMSSYCFGMVDGWFFNKDTGFISGASTTYKAQILSTVDGGNTWQVCYQSTRVDTDEVWKIFFPDRNTGYASIEYQAPVTQTPNRYFVKTIDGGKTWNEMPFISYYDEEGIGFINDSIGWIGGDYYMPTYITFDGGNTWNADKGFGILTPPYQSGKGYSMNRFRKINDTLMYASGNTVYKLNGGITGINELYKSANRVTNYPNPYSSETTIEYTLTQACHSVTLKVFAIRGQLIFSQNFGSQSSGNHEYVFKQGIPSGAYYYSITSDEYTITKKMIRIK